MSTFQPLFDAVDRGRETKVICPFHDEKTPSCIVYKDGHYHCYGCDAHGWVDDLRGKSKPYRRTVMREEKPIYKSLDWIPYRDAFTDRHVKRLAMWRGYNEKFIRSLVARWAIGIYEHQFCFPIWENGTIKRIHVRRHERIECKGSSFFYFPTIGCSISPMIETTGHGDAHFFESQWDMFAAMEQCRKPGMWIATRGAMNARKLGTIRLLPRRRFFYPQNDEPGEKWLEGCLAFLPKGKDVIVRTPDGIDDLNEYTKQGGKVRSLIQLT